MMTTIKNIDINWLKVFFIIFVSAYALLIVIGPNLNPTDDYMLLRTIQSGRPLFFYTNPPPGFPIGDLTKFGRFNFLGGMEYNLFGLFFKSPSAFWYYFFYAFQYIILMFLFIKILSRFTSNKFLIYLTPILLSLTPAAIPWFQTQLNDRNLIFYYAIFLFFYLNYLEKPKLYYLIMGVVGANMAIHYKENAFIALAAFAFCHLILAWKKSQPKTDEPRAHKLGLNPVRSNPPKADADTFSHRTSNGVKIFDCLVILSSFVYLILYYFVVYRHLIPNHVLWNSPVFSPLLIFIKNLFNYAFFNDPILILILLPFTGWRIYKFLRRQLELHPVYDSMLIAGSIFIMGCFVLNIYSPYYLLPAYIFALPPLIYFFSKREQRTLIFKGLAAICGLALIFNVFPTGIHYITYKKYLPINFNQTLDFLVKDINARYKNKRANIFIDAINPNGGGGVYFIIGEFLQYKGLTWDRFDFKSNVKTTNNIVQNIEDFQNHAPFTIFQNNKFFEISKGDYLIITTDDSTTKNITQEYIQSLSHDYNLIFKTSSPLAVPNLNLKTLAKYFLSKILDQSQKMKQGLLLNENLMQWPDYYVFIHK